MELRERVFRGNLYDVSGLEKAYPDGYILVTTTTALRLDADRTPTYFTNPGEDAWLTEELAEKTPIEEDASVTLLSNINGGIFRTDAEFNEVEVGQQFLIDGETLVRIENKTNRVVDQQPLEAIANEEVRFDHEDVFVIARDSPFGRFQYPTRKVKRFFRTDRVEKLVEIE